MKSTLLIHFQVYYYTLLHIDTYYYYSSLHIIVDYRYDVQKFSRAHSSCLIDNLRSLINNSPFFLPPKFTF